jgi:TRAP transporter TAXI family solute receptor
MKRFVRFLSALAPVLLVSTIASADTFVRMVSGPAGGSWYPLGAKIAEVLGKEVPGITTSNGPGGGVGNVKDVSKGAAELGWSYAHTAYNGFSGKGKFDAAQPNIRHFATLYPAAVQTAVPKDSSIQSYADMKDKSISPGKTTYSGYAAAELVFGQYGLTFDQVKQNGGTIHHVGYSDSVSLMKDGHLDVFIALTSVPQASFIDLDFNPGIRFIGIEPDVIDKILKENPGYLSTVIPTSAYKGTTADVATLGVVTVLVINKDVPDDVAYNMAKALWDNHGEFVKVKGIWNSVSLDDALRGAAIPVHPGAQRYYDEKGVTPK